MARTTKPVTHRRIDLTDEDIENRILESQGKIALLEAFAHANSLGESDKVSPTAWWGLRLVLHEIGESLDIELPLGTRAVRAETEVIQ